MKRIRQHSKAELNAVAVAAQSGDERANAELAKMMRPYVVKYLRNFQRNHFTREQQDDMTQHAWLGVWTALDRFDVSKDVKFSSYAWYWMRHEVMECVARNAGSVPLPRKAWHFALLLEHAYHAKYGETSLLYEAPDEALNNLEVSVVRDGRRVEITVPHAADIMRARKGSFGMQPEWDAADRSSAEDVFFKLDDLSGSHRTDNSKSVVDIVHLFLDSLDELDPDEWLSAAESFVESQNWPDSAAAEVLRFKEASE